MDKRLLAETYEAYNDEILLYVYSLCKNMEAAEDITHDVFTKAISSLPGDHANIRAWLYKVARNMTYNYNRKRSNAVKALNKLKEITVAAPDVSSVVVMKENYQELYEAIMKVNSRYREILIMQYFSDLSLKDAADVLGITPGNARILAHRARNKLKTLMSVNETKYEI